MYTLRDTDDKGGSSTCDQVEGRDDSSEHLASPSPSCQGNQTGFRKLPVQWTLRKHGDYCALNKMLEKEKDMTGKLGKSKKNVGRLGTRKVPSSPEPQCVNERKWLKATAGSIILASPKETVVNAPLC